MKTREEEIEETIAFVKKTIKLSLSGFIGTTNSTNNMALMTTAIQNVATTITQTFSNCTVLFPLHYEEVKDYVENDEDDKLIELLGNDEYYEAILVFKNIVSERVLKAIELAEILEK